ncbi:hypothetical protein JZ751_001557 [Albula glossodonta]|uniref:Uncharacterized protein n=1 Tax=Albula glossodonta TaxID=121402 RepID=A0A8T2PU33_9TELE|nr:hypothetical protein JZ751_001557 [Albula glossodonta]
MSGSSCVPETMGLFKQGPTLPAKSFEALHCEKKPTSLPFGVPPINHFLFSLGADNHSPMI